MKIDLFVDILKKSFQIIIKNYRIIWIGVLLEVLFFILYGLLSSPLVSIIQNNLETIGGEVVAKSSSVNKDFIINNVIKTPNFAKILISTMVLAIIVYLLYCFFHGVIWRFYLNLLEKKQYRDYIKKFFLVNIFWYILFVGWVIIDFLFTFTDTVGKRLDPQGTFFLDRVSLAIILVIAYFALISYAILSKEKASKSIWLSIRFGFKKIHWLVLMYFVIFLMYSILNYIAMLAGKAHLALLMLFGILIITPLAGWARIFIKNTVDNL